MNACLQSSYLCLPVYIDRRSLILSFENRLLAVLVAGSNWVPLDSSYYLIRSINIY